MLSNLTEFCFGMKHLCDLVSIKGLFSLEEDILNSEHIICFQVHKTLLSKKIKENLIPHDMFHLILI